MTSGAHKRVLRRELPFLIGGKLLRIVGVVRDCVHVVVAEHSDRASMRMDVLFVEIFYFVLMHLLIGTLSIEERLGVPIVLRREFTVLTCVPNDLVQALHMHDALLIRVLHVRYFHPSG